MSHANFLVSSDRMTRFVHRADELFVLPEFERLARDWYANWSQQPSWFGSNLWHARDRAVRFHWLPRSKVTPSTEKEDRTIRRRLSAIIGAVADGEPQVRVLAKAYDHRTRPVVPGTPGTLLPEERRVMPEARWVGVRRDLSEAEVRGGSSWESMWVTELDPDGAAMLTLIDAVSAGDADPVLFTNDCRRVLRPYAGGIDVLLESREARDALAIKFSTWLSPQHEWEPRSDEAPFALYSAEDAA